MNLLTLSTALLQLSIVLLFVLFLARIVRRRSPDLAAKIGTRGLMLGCLLVAFAVLDVPRFIQGSVTPSVRTTSETIVRSDETTPDKGDTPITFSLRPVLLWLASQDVVENSDRQDQVDWVMVFCMITLLLFLMLCVGFVATTQMHHRSTPIEVDGKHPLFECIRNENVSLRESSLLVVPCVTFYGGRTIYLPADWNQWPENELATALAHEIAHLNRRDARQRLLVQVACFVQWFHPMAWMISRGVTLSQEMAADRRAARTTDSDYAVSLSRIALRMDQRIHGRADDSMKHWFTRPGMVSVSSSHLIRRIKMLSQQTEGSVSRCRAGLAQLAVVTVFVSAACWNLNADQPDDNESGKTPAARVASVPKKSEIAGEPFSRPMISPWEHVASNNHGYGVVRVRQMLLHPNLAFARGVVDSAVDSAWRMIATDQSADNRAALGLGVSNIDDAIVSLQAVIENNEPKDDEDSDQNGKVTLGTDGLKLRFAEPISHDNVRAALDVSRLVQVGEQWGPLAEGSDMTTTQFMDQLIDGIFTSGTISRELAVQPKTKDANEQSMAELRRAWTQVDGGLLTLCSILPDSLGFVETDADKLADRVLSQASAIGIGIDIGQTNESNWLKLPIHVRFALLPADGVTIDQLVESIRVAVSAVKDEAEKVKADEPVDVERILQTLASIEISPSTSGDSVMVTLTAPIETFEVFGVF